ncbi:hypothetical protein [Congzhengia sp.]|uniref:hypothetical protein n=1 Tax=Congzhengia sp. TaxID=2944168 RepID=UPI003077E0F1
MCGICNIVRCITGRRNGCGCGCRTYENECDRRATWREPRMKIHCASGLGTEAAHPCGMDDDWDCGCNHKHDCDCEHKRPCGCEHKRPCDGRRDWDRDFDC